MSDARCMTRSRKFVANVYGLIWALFDKAAEYGLTKDEIVEVVEEQRALPAVRRPDDTTVTWAPMVDGLAERIEEDGPHRLRRSGRERFRRGGLDGQGHP